MINIYCCMGQAIRVGETKFVARIITAHSENDASAIMIKEMDKHYPQRDGWSIDYRGDVILIPYKAIEEVYLSQQPQRTTKYND